MNKCFIIGNLAKDPDIRKTQSGREVAMFTVAVNRRVAKDKQVPGAPTADFLPCVAWNKTAEIVERYCTKGKQVAIDGRIQVRSYDKDGVKHYVTEIVVNELELLGRSGSADHGDNRPPAPDDEEIPF